ncbi:MAG TPA: hypothetical protein PLS29_04985 [Acidimicrobiales bacterium]|nr:hypothetical protein [Acidimicrobiales bacterium]
MNPFPRDDKPLAVRLLEGFGRFWWDFLVGDTPEITLSVVGIVGVTALLRDVAHANAAAYVALVVLSVAALALSAARARARSRRG